MSMFKNRILFAAAFAAPFAATPPVGAVGK